MQTPLLRIDGQVECPLALSLHQLQALPEKYQIADVSQLDPARSGQAIALEALLERVQPAPEVKYITLHASTDDFHASLPLAEVRTRAVLIYALHGAQLPVSKGGPTRFFIPDHAACHTDEIDECANVKFVDRIELTAERGYDNRPTDEAEHAKLHEGEA